MGTSAFIVVGIVVDVGHAVVGVMVIIRCIVVGCSLIGRVIH
jgi:hypothetical protein